MSEESPPPKRDAIDVLLVRCPRLVDWTGAALGRMRSGSALRRRLMSLSIKRAFGAMARCDLELVLQRYNPDAEVWMRGMDGVGIGGCYRGHEGVRALYADVDGVFEKSGGGRFSPWSTVVIVLLSERTFSVWAAAAESRRH
jgi:hypothetical protein